MEIYVSRGNGVNVKTVQELDLKKKMNSLDLCGTNKLCNLYGIRKFK